MYSFLIYSHSTLNLFNMKTFLKKNLFKFMKKLFVFFFLLFLNSCGADEPTQNLTDEGGRMPSYIYSPSTTQIENIFLCEGEFSEKYHNNSNCRGLNNCSTELTNTSIENAITQGRTQCDICY